MIRVVIDTNVLISGLFWKGSPRRVIDLAADHTIEAFIGISIIKELHDVLKEDFCVPAEKLTDILKDVVTFCRIIPAKELPIAGLRDPNDAHVLSCVVAGKVQFIITGDKDLLTLKTYKRIAIVTPSEFLKITGLNPA